MKTFFVIIWVLIISVCNEQGEGRKVEEMDPIGRVDSLVILTKGNRTARLHLSKGYPKAKFVEVQISKVLNSKLYTLIFEVCYQEKEGKKTFLGAFSLYPENNPGRFIVATKGLLKNEGDVLVSYLLPENFNEQDTIQVEINAIQLSDGIYTEEKE